MLFYSPGNPTPPGNEVVVASLVEQTNSGAPCVFLPPTTARNPCHPGGNEIVVASLVKETNAGVRCVVLPSPPPRQPTPPGNELVVASLVEQTSCGAPCAVLPSPPLACHDPHRPRRPSQARLQKDIVAVIMKK